MPVIREYQRQVSSIGPIPVNQQSRHTSDEFGGQEGRALANAGQAVSSVADLMAKHIDQANTSDTTQKLTKANADLAIDLQNTLRTATPGDPKPFQDFQDRMEKTIGEVGDGASSGSARQFFQEASVRIKGQLTATAASGQAELAGIKAVQDFTDTTNNLSAASMADPTSVSLQRELNAQAINNLVATGQLPSDKAAKLLRESDGQIVRASIRGWAELNPDYAKQKLKSGEYDKELGAEGKTQMLGEIEQAVRAKEVDAERRRVQQERVLKQQQTVTQNDMLKAINEGKLTAKDILASNLDPTGSGSKEQFLNMLEKANSPERKLQTDPAVSIAVWNRIHLPEGHPDKIYDENELNKYYGNGLSMATLNDMREEIQGSKTEEGRAIADMKKQVFESAKAQLVKTSAIGLKDPIGEENMLRFQQYFRTEYQRRIAAGEKPMTILNPDDPNYIGKQIYSYVRTPTQIMQDMARTRRRPSETINLLPQNQPANAAGTQPVQRYQAPATPKIEKLPNETPAEYLARKKAMKPQGQ